MKRRNFLKNITVGVPALSSLSIPLTLENHFSNKEDIWVQVRKDFALSKDVLILNNGAVSPQSLAVTEYVAEKLRIANQGPSFYINRVIRKELYEMRWRLSQLMRVSYDEVAVNRNATEGLETIIFGFPLERGDEIVMSNLDYPPMRHAFLQRAKRDGIIIKEVQMSPENHETDDIVSLYKSQITPKTKLVLVTHVIHYTGQIMPVKEIAKEVKKKEVDVLVDGAHAFAHLDFFIKDLGVDYYAASLHKWLHGPLGTGVLYVKEDKIKKIWPLFSAENPHDECIDKFHHLGTLSVPTQLGIVPAIKYHEQIGATRKWDRFNDLKQFWVKKASSLIPGFELTIPIDRTNGIAHFKIEGIKSADIYKRLFREFKIYTMDYPLKGVFQGVRVSPNIFTTFEELKKFVQALVEISKDR